MKPKIAAVAEFACISILVWIALIVFLTTILFMFNISITMWNVVAPSVVVLGVALGISYYYRKTAPYLIGVVVMVITIVGSVWIAGSIYDISADGQDYHQIAIIKLHDGFNPVHQTAEPQDIYYNLLLNTFPKASWIFATSLYVLTGQIESGKAIHLLFMFSAFLLWAGIGLRNNRTPQWFNLLVAFILAFNPVSIYQSMSFYVDGLVSSSIILILGLMIAVYQEINLLKLVGLGAIIILGLNIKYTGSVYISIFGLVSFLALWLLFKKFRRIRSVFITMAVSVITAVIIVGFNPYATNTIRYKNPVYPVIGNEAFHRMIQGGIGLQGFADHSSIKKFIIATFSESYIGAEYQHALFKVPFQVAESELKAFTVTDVRLGGFGPWFGGALMLSFIGWIAAFFIDWRKALVATIAIAVIVCSMMITSEYWWARYAPQFWLVPVIVSVLLFFLKPKLSKVLSVLIVLSLLVNIVMISSSYYKGNISSTNQIKTTLTEMQNSGKRYKVYFGFFTPWKIRLEQYRIPFIEVPLNEMTKPSAISVILYQPVD